MRQCEQCHAELWHVSCESCGGLGADPEGEHAEECSECNGEGGWYECPMAAGGECGNNNRIDPTGVE
jgi:hypothetical protein